MAETAPTGLTWSDLQKLADDGLKRELIGGELLVTPSPVYRHQWAAMLLSATLLEAVQPGAAGWSRRWTSCSASTTSCSPTSACSARSIWTDPRWLPAGGA